MTFNVNTTLTTSYDVIEEAPADSHSYVKERCKYIPTIEEKIFRACFSYEFYLQMIADAIEYTRVEGNDFYYTDYVDNTEYSTGDYVLYCGIIYECIVDTDGNQDPNNSSYFKRAKKFNNDDYNWLWGRYLKKLICWSVMYSSVMYRLIRDTAKGVVKNYSDGSSVPATLQELQALKGEAMNDAEDIKRIMLKWVDENMKTVLEDTCGTGNCKRQTHFGFYTKGWEKHAR